MATLGEIGLITPENKPAASVMSLDQVAHVLLLDCTQVKNPRASVQRYIDLGQLRALRIGREVRVTAEAVLDFLSGGTEQEPRGHSHGRKRKLIEERATQ